MPMKTTATRKGHGELYMEICQNRGKTMETTPNSKGPGRTKKVV